MLPGVRRFVIAAAADYYTVGKTSFPRPSIHCSYLPPPPNWGAQRTRVAPFYEAAGGTLSLFRFCGLHTTLTWEQGKENY